MFDESVKLTRNYLHSGSQQLNCGANAAAIQWLNDEWSYCGSKWRNNEEWIVDETLLAAAAAFAHFTNSSIHSLHFVLFWITLRGASAPRLSQLKLIFIAWMASAFTSFIINFQFHSFRYFHPFLNSTSN